MKLYHWTKKENTKSILNNGLKVNGIGYIYLSKFKDLWKNLHKDGVLIECTINKNIKLTCFDEEQNGEQILCWSNLEKEKLKILKNE